MKSSGNTGRCFETSRYREALRGNKQGTTANSTLLVNDAGVFEFLPLGDVTPQHFYKQFDLNALGLLLTTQEVVKLIGAEGGSIVNVSSIVGPMPVPNASVYSATKAAVDAITVSLAGELGPKKVRVNSINLGMVETEGLHAAGFAGRNFRKHTEATTPLPNRHIFNRFSRANSSAPDTHQFAVGLSM